MFFCWILEPRIFVCGCVPRLGRSQHFKQAALVYRRGFRPKARRQKGMSESHRTQNTTLESTHTFWCGTEHRSSFRMAFSKGAATTLCRGEMGHHASFRGYHLGFRMLQITVVFTRALAVERDCPFIHALSSLFLDWGLAWRINFTGWPSCCHFRTSISL